MLYRKRNAETDVAAQKIRHENRHLWRAGEAISAPYRKHPLPETVEKAITHFLQYCVKTGYPITEEDFVRLVSLGKLSEKEIAVFPEGMTAIALRLAKHGSAAALQTACQVIRVTERLEHRLLYEAGSLHRLLSEDSVYPKMHPRSQGACRAEIAYLAEKQKCPETEIAERLLQQAKTAESPEKAYIGYWLQKALAQSGTAGFFRRFFPLLSLLLAAIFTGLFTFLTDLWGICAFPLFEQLAAELLQSVVRRCLPHRSLPRMRSADTPTLCVIAALLTKEEQTEKLAQKLAEYAIAANNPCLSFGILADFPETAQKELPMERALLDTLRKTLEGYNALYGKRFYLFSREKRYVETEAVWRGWERKRGAILQLTHRMSGKTSEIVVLVGEAAKLTEMPYLIVLDEDTTPAPGALSELVAAAEHPLNRPILSADGRSVVAGYGILNPSLSVSLKSAYQNRFTRLHAGSVGFSRYAAGYADTTFDRTGTTAFTGKGLLYVRLFSDLLAYRFPENTILSHDLPEGELLRTGYCAAAEFSDSIPRSRAAYEKRQHRWIRGDIQNLCLLRTVKSRRILENVWHALTPLYLLILLWITSRFSANLILAVFICRLVPFLTLAGRGLQTMLSQKRPMFSALFHTLAEAIQRNLDTLFFLPYSAAVTLDAIARSAFRMLFTKRKRLEWSTAAETKGNIPLGMAGTILVMLIFFMTHSPISVILAALWLCGCFAELSSAANTRLVSRETMAVSALVSVSRETQRLLQNPDCREQLQKLMAESIEFYTRYATRERSWLPPDNVQLQPILRIAERTSPTNVGLTMLSLYAGAEMGLIEKAETWERLERMTESLQRWEKWKGHPVNWIDPRTMETLHPAWVSTVDSGNLAFCLAALIEGDLPENIRDTLKTLLTAMDFSALYDEKQSLFRIGRNLETGEWSAGVYDLANSEARLASYWAIAAGQVPYTHWNALKRPKVAEKGRMGLASWSGTMFETVLPMLFLPSARGDVWQKTAIMLCAEQREVGQKGVWGMSESGYYAFDEELNYQYKAHGIRSMTVGENRQESVYAPYAAIMALPFMGKAAWNALKAYEKLGMHGQYGFYEAWDAERGGVAVRSYMAHHQGMSALTLWTLLNGGAVRLCMKNPQLHAFLPLLEETLSETDACLRRTRKTDKKRKDTEKPYLVKVSQFDYRHPRLTILGNPGYQVLITDDGRSISRAGKRMITGVNFTEGVECWLDETPLFPRQKSGVRYSCTLTEKKAFHESRFNNWETRIETLAAAEVRAEQRRITIRNTAPQSRTATLRILYTPILATAADYCAHPAYSAMFLHTEIAQDNQTVVIHREPRGTEPAIWSAVRFSEAADIETRREAVPRGMRFPETLSGTRDGYVLNPRISAAFTLTWKPGEKRVIRFALSYGESRETALENAAFACRMKPSDAAERLHYTAKMLEMSGKEVEEALELYAGALFGETEDAMREGALRNCRLPRTVLWKTGISGTLPVVTADVGSLSGEKLMRLLKAHLLLFTNAAMTDLLLLCEDGGAYERTLYGQTREAMEALDMMNLMNVPGGVHLCDPKKLSVPESTALLAYSDVLLHTDDNGLHSPIRIPGLCPLREEQPCRKPVTYHWEKHEFCFTGQPPIAWSHVLTNRIFGWLATEAGSGFAWYYNARENKLNAWQNDPYAVEGTEKIRYRRGKKSVSAFSEGGDAAVTFACGYAVWEKQWEGRHFRMTAYVHPIFPARVLLFETDAEGVELEYRMPLQMGANPSDGKSIVTDAEGNILYARNPGNGDYGIYQAIIATSTGFSAYTCDAESAEYGLFDEWSGAGKRAGFAFRVPLKAGRAVVVLGVSTGGKSMAGLKALTDYAAALNGLRETTEVWEKRVNSGSFQRATPEERLYLDGFALYQVIAVRLWGRTSLWQNGGAFGFRDQLQDVIALLEAPPDMERLTMARIQLLRCAARQYTQGDVQHWWHPRRNGKARGVRTQISDDLLFLPWVTALYTQKVQDNLLDIQLPYLESAPLGADEKDRYEEAEYGTERESVYGHCVRALELVPLRGIGVHGLLKMGGGDWNDGMNTVQGESVWLTLFASAVYRDFAAVARKRGDEQRANRYHDYALSLRLAAERVFTGEQYPRGYYADGTMLGQHGACEVDAIVQGFAAVAGTEERQVRIALKTAIKRLIDDENRLVRLFTPPFTHDTPEHPGYIAAYPPGTRENGGQYTHGAIWLAWGAYLAGLTAEGDRIMRLLCPTDRQTEIYRAEPYALCADVYASPAPAGRGGWSLYTGAASWYYTIARRFLTDNGGEFHA